jgi:zinc finger CCHC domain-containing protein 9
MRRDVSFGEELWLNEERSTFLFFSVVFEYMAHGMRSTDANGNNNPVLFAPSTEVTMGADEDDFHTFKRRTAQIERHEKKEEKAKRMMDMKAGVHSGVIKAFGKPPVPSTKKVVYF